MKCNEFYLYSQKWMKMHSIFKKIWNSIFFYSSEFLFTRSTETHVHKMCHKIKFFFCFVKRQVKRHKYLILKWGCHCCSFLFVLFVLIFVRLKYSLSIDWNTNIAVFLEILWLFLTVCWNEARKLNILWFLSTFFVNFFESIDIQGFYSNIKDFWIPSWLKLDSQENYVTVLISRKYKATFLKKMHKFLDFIIRINCLQVLWIKAKFQMTLN